MRRASIALCLLAAACGPDAPDRAPRSREKTETAQSRIAPTVPAAPSAQRTDAELSDGKGAAAALRRYYDHIEAGRYRDAWAMRSASEAGYERFERNFAAYRSYKVMLGPATVPVKAGGWAYVEVPIQITGTMTTGAGFGSVGSVTMRRAVDVPDATARQRAWHIHTG
jgi:hypothetical protein